MPPMLKDIDPDSDSDGGSFEAVTPEHNCEDPETREETPLTEKRRCILEDVDGELEMEDVTPSPAREIEPNSITDAGQIKSVQTSDDQLQRLPCSALPPPQELASIPPLPSSSLPVPPPPPPPSLPLAVAPASGVADYYADGVGSKLSPSSYVRLPLVCSFFCLISHMHHRNTTFFFVKFLLHSFSLKCVCLMFRVPLDNLGLS